MMICLPKRAMRSFLKHHELSSSFQKIVHEWLYSPPTLSRPPRRKWDFSYFFFLKANKIKKGVDTISLLTERTSLQYYNAYMYYEFYCDVYTFMSRTRYTYLPLYTWITVPHNITRIWSLFWVFYKLLEFGLLWNSTEKKICNSKRNNNTFFEGEKMEKKEKKSERSS